MLVVNHPILCSRFVKFMNQKEIFFEEAPKTKCAAQQSRSQGVRDWIKDNARGRIEEKNWGRGCGAWKKLRNLSV